MGSLLLALHALIIVAHPDDEYCMAATLYHLTHDLGAKVDQVVITNGEGGYRFAVASEKLYEKPLSQEAVGRKELPAIRKRELEEAGRVLGVSARTYLEQRDDGRVDSVSDALASWDRKGVASRLDQVLHEGHYDVVFTLLPTPATHGHHKAAAVLALEAVSRLKPDDRPAVLGCWNDNRRRPPRDADQRDEIRSAKDFRELAGQPLTRLLDPEPLSFDREAPFGPEGKLNSQIYVNWMIAAHKSQGLFQTYVLRDDTENFSLFQLNAPAATERARTLFHRIDGTVSPR